MKFSNRIQSVNESPIRKLVPIADKAIDEGKKVYYLNIGQPDIETPKEFFTAIRNFDGNVLEYASSHGLPELLKYFSDYYKDMGLNYDPKDILITNGGSEALLFSLTIICDDGDNVIVPEPFYANYNSFSSSLGVHLNPVLTTGENGFHLPSKEDILNSIDEKTKALLISNPGNPTGTVYTPDEIHMLAEIALEKDLFIVSDEVYREFIYNDTEFISFGSLKDLEDRVILIDSISKRFSSCGARIGCIASKNNDFIFEALKLAQSRLCVSTLNQIGAAAFKDVSKEYIKNSISKYKKRRDVVYSALSQMEGVECEEPEGAFYLTAKLPVESSEDFIVWLLENFSIDNETVFMSPAEGFYITEGLGKNEVRISYVIDSASLTKAMKIIKEGLIEYNKNKSSGN